MSFVHLAYLPWILGLIALFILLNFIYEFRYFSWIKRYWFLKRSWWSRLSSLFYVLGISLLLLSLLDLRGPEVRIKANIPDQKTLILIDASMSMMAEDVRPSRFQRSLLMARHFVSKAVGHQISVSIFSDNQKNIIPFTDDVDLLDSRIGALEEADLSNAGSNIKQALAEAIQVMREEIGSADNATGNILIFSDGEEHENFKGLEVPAGINVAFVGVGTLQGAPLPIRRGSGQYAYFDSFKQHRGERVISKLNEDFIKMLGSQIKSYQYWIATSYSMPTDEIISFFRTIFKAKSSQGEVKVRPVMYEYIVLPGVISLMIGFLLSLPRTFVVLAFCLGFAVQQSSNAKEEEKEKQLSPETMRYMERLKKGELSREEKLKLGEYLLRDGKAEAALSLYEENKAKDSDDNDAIYNYGVALLKSGKLTSGAEVLDELQRKIQKEPSKKNEELSKNIEESLKLAFKSEKQKKNQNQDQKQNEQNQKQEEQKGEDKSKQSKDQKGQNQQGQKDQKEQKDGSKQDDKKKNAQDQQSQQGKGSGKEDFDKLKKNQGEKKDEKKEEKKDDQGKDGSEKDENQKEQNKPKSLEDKEEQIRKQRMMKKLSGNLKELMNVDRQLQQKFLDTRIKDRVQNRDHKDW